MVAQKINTDQRYESLFREYYTALCYFARKYIADMDTCKEIVHTVFVGVWERREDFDFEKPAKSYLFTSVYNRCMNHIRDQKKFVDNNDGETHDYLIETSVNNDHLEEAELEAKIWEGIGKLPEKCRQVFELNRFEGKKYGEIAEQLNLSVKTVEAQMSKALKAMRQHLADYIHLLLFLILKNLW